MRTRDFLNAVFWVQGVQAKTKDLKAVFGTEDHLQCCLFILEKGELQVSDKEREVQLDRFEPFQVCVTRAVTQPICAVCFEMWRP